MAKASGQSTGRLVAKKPASESIALVYNSDYYLYRFRQGLIRTLRQRGYTVYAVAPQGEFVDALENAGAIFVPWHVKARGINPFAELRSLLALRRIFKRLRPTVSHHFTVKPNIYGAIAARLAGTQAVVTSVTGLGYPLTNPPWKAKAIGSLVRPLYRFSLGLSDAITFQNKTDLDLLIGADGRNAGKAHYMPGGSGVDLTFFHPDAPEPAALVSLRRELKLQEGAKVVALIGRMLWEKGVAEYRACAGALRNRYPNWRFLLVGPTEEGSPGYIPKRQLNKWAENGVFSYLGERSDVRDILALTDLVVLSSYWEGTSRLLLEASAMGKPIVTSNAPGCRDVVEDDVTGLLVPPRNIPALCTAVETLMIDGERGERFGRAARLKPESTEGRPWGQPLKKAEGAPLNLG